MACCWSSLLNFHFSFNCILCDSFTQKLGRSFAPKSSKGTWAWSERFLIQCFEDKGCLWHTKIPFMELHKHRCSRDTASTCRNRYRQDIGKISGFTSIAQCWNKRFNHAGGMCQIILFRDSNYHIFDYWICMHTHYLEQDQTFWSLECLKIDYNLNFRLFSFL